MCGIAGIVQKDCAAPADLDGVRRMTETTAHRGPDDAGHEAWGPVALGHRRLAILDLSPAGHQPMVSPDGRRAIVFNGEIYNYLELREELRARGADFRTGADTEVILEAYRVWGTDCVRRFNGMWALALYDVPAGSIFLSRDRFGVKPLYYLDRPDVFAFCSEPKGLLAAYPEERRANLPFLHYFLPSGAQADGPETFFENVRALPPAHSALYDVRRGTLTAWRHWEADVEAFRREWGGGDPVETLWGLLNSSVRLRMRSDVPVGTCLSGGVDSSTIVGLMATMRSDPVRTFSGLYPDDADCNESRYVAAVNRHTGAAPCSVLCEPRGSLLEDLAKITWHQDEPTAGPGLYTQYHVMRHACREVTVILDGQGGDELFAGYLPYFALQIEDLVGAGGLGNRLRAAQLFGQVSWHWGPRWVAGVADRVLGRPVAAAARRLAARSKGRTAEPPFFHPGLAARVEGRQIVRERPPHAPTALGNTLYWHLVQQSIPALLHYEDRNSMAYSLEARVPLLDYRIVEFALALDSRYKLRGSWTKWALRKAAERVVPREVAWRRSKLGYPTPFARWLRQEPDRSDFRDLLFSKEFLARELVTEESLRHYWDQHQAGAVDRSWLLYRYATTELWHRQFIDAWRPNPATTPAPTPTPKEPVAARR